MSGATIRFSADFSAMSSLLALDGTVYSCEQAMIQDAIHLMTNSGKLYTSQARSNFSGLAVNGGRFARKQARKSARKEQREFEAISAELGIS